MSGGSYGYFCYKDKDDLSPFKETLEEIAGDMGKHSTADVSDVLTELEQIRQLMDQVSGRVLSLHHVLHAFEWWMSGDYNQEQFQKKVQDWRRHREEIKE
jgi:hypothetical protein